MLEDWLKAVRGKAMAVLPESLGGKNVSQDLVSELSIGAVRMAIGEEDFAPRVALPQRLCDREAHH